MLEAFGLDPDVVHLNHGAYGVAPVVVRRAAEGWREDAERNPHRFNRVELPGLIAAARVRAAGFLGVDPDRVGWVRNVSEGVSAVLGSLDLRPGDELVASNHGYGAVRLALEHHAARAGARVIEASFPVGAEDDGVVAAYAGVCGPRTRLVVVDRITSPTATVLPVAAVAAAVDAPVLVDAAHAPGHLDDRIDSLGAAYWVGNLHKWAYTPRGTALLWHDPALAAAPAPLVKSWQLEDGFARALDHPGTWDYAGWLAAGAGLDFWVEVGGWDQVARHTDLVGHGQKRVAEALGTSLDGLPGSPAPAMRLVRLPDGVASTEDDVVALYDRLSAHGVEVAPVLHDGAGYLRLGAAPYTTPDDFDRLAEVLTGLGLPPRGSLSLR